MTQERIQKPKPRQRDEKGRYTKAEPQPRSEETQDKLDAADELLDEIDAVLDDVLGEESAQEFVSNYRQKGGE